MFKKLRDWLFGPEITDPNDPAYDEYPDIIPDISVEEIMRRLGIEDEGDDDHYELGGEG